MQSPEYGLPSPPTYALPLGVGIPALTPRPTATAQLCSESWRRRRVGCAVPFDETGRGGLAVVRLLDGCPLDGRVASLHTVLPLPRGAEAFGQTGPHSIRGATGWWGSSLEEFLGLDLKETIVVVPAGDLHVTVVRFKVGPASSVLEIPMEEAPQHGTVLKRSPYL